MPCHKDSVLIDKYWTTKACYGCVSSQKPAQL